MTPSQLEHLREWLDHNIASADTAYADKALRELYRMVEIQQLNKDPVIVTSDSVMNPEFEFKTFLNVESNNIKQPNHYTWHPSGIECKTITSAFNYNLGTAIAYIWRCEYKGTKRQDLEKAIQHLTFELENMEDD